MQKSFVLFSMSEMYKVNGGKYVECKFEEGAVLGNVPSKFDMIGNPSEPCWDSPLNSDNQAGFVIQFAKNNTFNIK